jgi:hypothetical protein
MARENLSDHILEISRDYLGPAAERFVNRQIVTHLRKKPETLTKSDVYKLIDWLKLSFSLLTDNTKLVDEYTHRLSLVASGESEKALGGQWQQK